MKHIASVIAVMLAFRLVLWQSAALAQDATAIPTGVKYAVKVHEFEGCECNPVCPCVFSSDTTFGDCRGITVFTFNGMYGGTALRDVSCVLVFTWAGKNMETNMGKWRGVLYLSETGTSAQFEAVDGLLRVMMGDAFSALEKRTAPIQIKRENDVHDLTIGKVARLRIHALKGQNGEIAKILNAPSPLAYPEMSCAVADIHTYDDGRSSWNFAGRNGFYADFNLSSEKQ